MDIDETKNAEAERSSGAGAVDQSPFGECTELPESPDQYFHEFKNLYSPAWKRFQYLFKRSSLIGASVLLICITMTSMIIVVRSFLHNFHSPPYSSLPGWLCILLFLLTLSLSAASWLLVGRTATLPYVAPVREQISELPHEQALLRGSSPSKEIELLMPAGHEGTTSSTELLRSASTADVESKAYAVELEALRTPATAPQEQWLG